MKVPSAYIVIYTYKSVTGPLKKWREAYFYLAGNSNLKSSGLDLGFINKAANPSQEPLDPHASILGEGLTVSLA